MSVEAVAVKCAAFDLKRCSAKSERARPRRTRPTRPPRARRGPPSRRRVRRQRRRALPEQRRKVREQRRVSEHDADVGAAGGEHALALRRECESVRGEERGVLGGERERERLNRLTSRVLGAYGKKFRSAKPLSPLFFAPQYQCGLWPRRQGGKYY